MPFMQKQVTRKLLWIEIDGTCGTTWIPAEDAPLLANLIKDQQRTAEPTEESRKLALDYYEGVIPEHIWTIQLTTGYGARLSAPGYTDCTEWTVFDTPEEAQAYLDENFPDEEE